MKSIKEGDEVLTVDVLTNKTIAVKVQGLTEHVAKNYAITTLLLVNVKETITQEGTAVTLISKALQVTPNHPVQTANTIKEAGKIVVGDKLFCMNDATKNNQLFTVWNTTEQAGGTQKVYNIVAESGTTFIMNNVVVRQKQ
ncbi:MAG: hypothetical protein H7068_03555 [Pedobacter sp.]|nr:hypothetical protein [Chitinophagaceae bacterium]